MLAWSYLESEETDGPWLRYFETETDSQIKIPISSYIPQERESERLRAQEAIKTIIEQGIVPTYINEEISGEAVKIEIFAIDQQIKIII